MALTVTTSTDIASLDSKIIADLCAGIFYTDITPSVYIGTYLNVEGVSLRVTNPYGVVVKEIPTSGFDVYYPLTDDIEVAIPTQAGNYQYGTYTFLIRFTDSAGLEFEITKTVSICQPDLKNKTRNYGTLSARLDGVCKDGKLFVIADSVPTYKGVISTSQVNDFSLEYPTSSGIAVLETTQGNFVATLFEGVYKFTGTICALYSLGDNVFAKVNYRVKREKNIRCLLDESCIAAQLEMLGARINSDCSEAEKIVTNDKIINTLRLVKTIELLMEAGFDASDYVEELETLLGCVCTCNCADGTPVINTTVSPTVLIEGCGVDKVTVDLTDTYTINNYTYVVAVTDNGGAITITTATLDGCTQTQTITFNIAAVYTQIKAQVDDSTEYDFWASIIRLALEGLDTDCLTAPTDTLEQLVQAIINKACSGGDCEAEISGAETSDSGADVVVTWTNDADVHEVAVYLDDILQGTVLDPTETFTILGAADGDTHTYKLICKCSNGSIGNLLDGTFTYIGCPTIALPDVSDTSVEDATCPYDLTVLVDPLPVGITAEWHTSNSTSVKTLVADPENVADGSYYVFAKNAEGCYSLGVNVVVVCTEDTACSAPQTLLVEAIDGGYRVRFQSAAFPPPSNSYTVKRRLYSAADVDGSYTTIGTPTWDVSSARWQILDATAVANTLYVYRAISNCASSAPYVDYTFANLTCPVVTLTPNETTVDYSFTNVGGEVDKYDVNIYNSSVTTLIDSETETPAFASPITGQLIYLTPSTTYRVRVVVYIGTYSKTCSLLLARTDNIYTALTISYGTNLGTACGFDDTVYIDNAYDDIETGIFVYTDAALTTVLTGATHITTYYTQEIFLINTGTGQVGATTGVFC